MAVVEAEGLSVAVGMASGCPFALADRVVISLSMASRVARVSSSTSAAVRPFVEIGSRTIDSPS